MHRLLQASILLDSAEEGEDQLQYARRIIDQLPDRYKLDAICKRCNDKKMGAQKAQEASDKFYLSLYLQVRTTFVDLSHPYQNHPVTAEGIIVGVGEKYLNCLIPSMGEDRRIYFEDIKEIKEAKYEESTKTNIIIWQDGTPQELRVMSEVKVRVSAKTRGEFDMNILDSWLILDEYSLNAKRMILLAPNAA